MSPVRLHLRVIRDRGRLDASLAEGADPTADPALAVRARALSAERARRRLAATITNLLDAAEEPPEVFGPYGPQPPLQRQSILAARPELEELGERLAAHRPLPVQAVALTALLVWDAASPMYTLRDDATVIGWTLAALGAAAGAYPIAG
jgi:hypothetical protein